jgi:hypothetical protein
MTNRDTQRSQPAIRLGDGDSLDRLRPIAFGTQLLRQLSQEGIRPRSIDDVLTRLTIHARGAVLLEHQPPGGRQHVVPIDPVVQGVKPELRLLLGLLTQLSSQFRDLGRQADSRLHFRGTRTWSVGRLAVVFRSGTLVQADLLTSGENISSPGDLRSTGITPLRRYYVPLRLPRRPAKGYGFPLAVESESDLDPTSPRRASQVSWMIFRHPPSPSTPESPVAASARCLTTDIRLHHLGKDGHSHSRNEAEPGSRLRITADVCAVSGFDNAVTPVAAELASW